MTPVFAPRGASLRYVVASRAHHADIGGITPGSMPPQSRTIADEGVLFDGVRIVERRQVPRSRAPAAARLGTVPARAAPTRTSPT